MIGRITGIVFLLIGIGIKGYCQQSGMYFQGGNDSITFTDYVTWLEKKSKLNIFYRQEWVFGLKVAASDTSLPLIETLRSNLSKTGYHFYQREKDIFIYPGKEIITKVPAFTRQQPDEMVQTQINNTEESAEQYYTDTGISNSIEVLTIGSKEKTDHKKCMITGTILNKSDGEPLTGATAYIEEKQLGVVSDAVGKLKLELAPGIYRCEFNYIGMKQQTRYLQVYSDGSFSLEMGEEPIKISEVTVTANRYDNVRGMQMGFEKITSKTIKEIPVVLGEKDILKVAQMLPGIQSVGEGSSGFNVRGSSADQNMFYINGVPVYNTSHLFGFFTSFSPDIIENFSLFKSNIPARYGGRLASVFDISTRQGNKTRMFGQGGISPVTGHFSVEGPIGKNMFNREKPDKISYVASWRSTYSDWILRQVKDEDIRNSSAFFYDATLAINSELNNKNLLKLFGYNSHDRFSFSSKNDYSYTNIGFSALWKHLFSQDYTVDLSAIYTSYYFSNTDKNDVSEAYHYNYEIDQYETKADFLFQKIQNHRIEFGADVIYYNLNRGDIIPYGSESLREPSLLGREHGIENAVYISNEFRLFPKLGFLIGLRYSFYTQLGPDSVNIYLPGTAEIRENVKNIRSYRTGELIKFYSGPEPRLALNYQLARNTALKASYNKLRQYIFMLSNTIAISPTDQWKLADIHIEPPVVDQVSFGIYQDNSKKTLHSSLEIYRKWMNHIVEYRDGADFLSGNPVEQQILQGNQKAWGVEFMLRKNGEKFSGWLSYAWSRSFVQVNSDLSENRINYGKAYPSNYDRPHSLNLVTNSRLNRRLSFSANLVYITGRPITYPISVYTSEGHQVLNYSARNEYRIPDYFRVDISVNLEGNLRNRKIAHSYWMLNIYNLFGRKNAYSVYYTIENEKIQGYKLSVFAQPIVTLSWHFKFGNYLSD